MAVLATIGAIDTGAITLKRWGLMGSLTCPGGAEGCDKVLNSAWGSLFGYPLSLFGFLAYGVLLVMALVPLLLPREARTEVGQRTASRVCCTGSPSPRRSRCSPACRSRSSCRS